MDPTTSLSTAEAAVQITRTNETWTGRVGQPATVTYGFVGLNGDLEFNDAQMATTEQVLDLWADLANLTFVRIGGWGNAQISFVHFDDEKDGGGAAATGQVGRSVDVGFNLDAGNAFDLDQGEADRQSLIHEIGHALGLEHPGNYNVGSVGDPEPTYEANRGYVEDSKQYTVMTYFSEEKTGADFNGAHARTPLLHDIAAIQRLYGANMTTRTGDTVYGYNSNADRAAFHVTSSKEKPVFAIWDAGGIDTLDFSGSTSDQVISLWANSFSSVNGLTDNIAIAGDDIKNAIENAKGGFRIDIIYGNDLANEIWGGADRDTLYGNGGNDTLYGDDGNDTLWGNGGNDKLIGGAGEDTYIVEDRGDRVTETQAGGHDTVKTTLNDNPRGLDNNVEDLKFIGTGNFVGRGNQLANVITGGDGTDTLRGLAGNDTLDGGIGADTMYGGLDDDTYIVDHVGDKAVEDVGFIDRHGNIYTTGHDTIQTTLKERGLDNNVEDLVFIGTGNFIGRGNQLANGITGGGGDDTLYGFADNDTLNGGIGADTMYGGLDDDTYFVDDEGDKAVEDVAFMDRHGNIYPTGHDTVKTTLNERGLDNNVEDLVFIGTGEFIGRGNSGDNTIVGGSAPDTLTGAGGDDTLTGNRGSDTFVFGDGWGHDTVTDFDMVTDFTPGDKLDMRQVSGLLRWSQLTITDTEQGAKITFGGPDSITLLGVKKAELTASSFRLLPTLVAGTDGNDVLEGDGSPNDLMGLAGDDTLIGRGSADVLDGGLGIDTADYSASSAGVTVNLATGTGLGGDAEGDILMSIEHAIGSAFDDSYQGGADRGRFIAGDGNDTMTGGSWYDWLEGGNGDDTFIGTGGMMVMFGGDGKDTMTGSLDNSNYIDGGIGNDTLVGGNTTDYIADVIGGDDTLRGGGGADTLVDLYGVSELYGEGGDDFMSAAGGSGLVDGGADKDYISVANGNYTMVGGEGDDTLEAAGYGVHTFTGGAGADIFTYRVGGDQPWIVTDFEDGVDRIFLWDYHYNGNVPFESLAITDSAAGAVVSWNGVSHMVLTGILASQLTQGDFFY